MPNTNEPESVDRGMNPSADPGAPPPLRDEDLTDDERAEQDRRIDAIGAGRPWREVLADVALRKPL